MNRKSLSTLCAAAILAASATWTEPVQAVPAPSPAVHADVCGPRCSGALQHRRGRAPGRHARLALAIQRNPSIAVVANLRAIERVYRHERRIREIPGFYRGVLARTGDPLVRNFVHYRLARLDMRGNDVRGALDVLLRNLDENLQRLN